MSENFDWIRYWCPNGDNYYIDQNGYVIDPSTSQFSANSHLVQDPFRQPQHCVILLGEPGIGKSTAMNKFCAEFNANHGDSADEIHLIKLETLSTDVSFKSEMIHNDVVQTWLEGNHNLYLLLDSFDECVIRVDILSNLLLNVLEKFPRDRLYLRIACRTGEWPINLSNSLSFLFSFDQFKLLKLVPLRKRDIEESAEKRIEIIGNKSPTDFIRNIERLEIVPFAIHPITLKFLLNIYTKENTFPNSKKEIYNKGCLILCEEVSQTRREYSRDEEISSEHRYIVAARIAAYCVFSKCTGIWTDIDLGNVPENVICELSLSGYKEQILGQEFDVTQYIVHDTLLCGLFNSAKPNRQWSHKTYMDFLASEYLIKRSIPLEQIRSLIINPLDPEKRINPHLKGVVSWLCLAYLDLFEEILAQEPEIILQIDANQLPDGEKREVVKALLENFDRSSLRLNYHNLTHLLRKFSHSQIIPQISNFISEENNSLDSKRFAIRIAEECELIGMASQLIDLILDDSKDIHLRISAASAIESFSNKFPIKKREELIPFALVDEPMEDNFDLKGICLHIVWPDLITSTQLFDHLPAPRIDYSGTYFRFLLGKLIGALPEAEIVTALNWISKSITFSSVFGRTIDLIILKALKFVKNEQIFSILIKAFAKIIVDDRFMIEMGHHNESNLYLKSNQTTRRSILREIFRELPDERVIYPKLYPFLTSQPRFFDLVYEEDFDWLLEVLNCSEEGEYRQKLIKLITRMLRFRADREEKGMALYRENEILKPHLVNIYGNVKIDSDTADEMKRIYIQDQEFKEKLSELNKKPLVEPPPEERIGSLLKKFNDGKIDSWLSLNREMTLNKDSRHYGDPYNPDLTTLPGWLNSSDEIKEKVVNAAKIYISEGDPQNSTWVGKDIIAPRAFAGYRAIRLIYYHDYEYISKIPPNIWKKWTPIILLFPFGIYGSDEEENIRKDLLKIAFPYAEDELFYTIDSKIEYCNQNERPILLFKKLDNLYSEQLGDFLQNKALQKHLSVERKGEIFDFLLKHKHLKTSSYLVEMLSKFISTEFKDENLIIRCTWSLILYSENGYWDIVWHIIQHNEERGRKILRKVTRNIWSKKQVFDKYSENQLADLYIWLIDHCSSDKEAPLPEGAWVLKGFQQMIIRYLEEKGTYQAVDAIKRIANELPEEIEDFSYRILSTSDIALKDSWTPPAIEELRELFQNPSKRIIQTESQLVDLIDESLTRLEMKLQGNGDYSAAARFLWDNTKNRRFKPVVEDDFTDFVKNHLINDITRGIVVQREVEISPQEHKTDLLVSILSSKNRTPQNRPISVLVEVKGSWNPDLKIAMETQLLDEYMIPNAYKSGMYLVGWFKSDYWDSSDSRRNKHARIRTIEDLKIMLEDQAKNIKDRGYFIKPKIIDASLTQIHERRYPSGNS